MTPPVTATVTVCGGAVKLVAVVKRDSGPHDEYDFSGLISLTVALAKILIMSGKYSNWPHSFCPGKHFGQMKDMPLLMKKFL